MKTNRVSLLTEGGFYKFIWREAHNELTTCKQAVQWSLVEVGSRMWALDSQATFKGKENECIYR